MGHLDGKVKEKGETLQSNQKQGENTKAMYIKCEVNLHRALSIMKKKAG